MKRFQECSKLEQLWRFRWYLKIPFQYVYFTFFKSFKEYKEKVENDELIHTNEHEIMKGKILWSLLLEKAQSKMMWHYTREEAFDILLEKIKNLE